MAGHDPALAAVLRAGDHPVVGDLRLGEHGLGPHAQAQLLVHGGHQVGRQAAPLLPGAHEQVDGAQFGGEGASPVGGRVADVGQLGQACGQRGRLGVDHPGREPAQGRGQPLAGGGDALLDLVRQPAVELVQAVGDALLAARGGLQAGAPARW